MPGKLVVQRNGRTVRLVAHLDTAKVTEDGAPDPDWVYEAQWTADDRNPGESVGAYQSRMAAWVNSVKAEFRLLAQEALARKAAPESAASLLGEPGEAL